MSASTGRIFGMKRLVYVCAGGLLCVNFIPHAFPFIVRKSSEAKGIQAPVELVLHVQKIAASMDDMLTYQSTSILDIEMRSSPERILCTCVKGKQELEGLAHPDRVKVFINNGFSSLCGGCTLLPMGAVIGLPRTVLFRDERDVFQCDISVKGEPVEWESEEGQQLLKLLPPSAKLINFRIAHEVAHLKSYDFLYYTVLSPVVLVCGYHFSVFMSKAVFPGRIVAAFPLLFSLALIAQVQISSTVRHWQEFRADKKAAMCKRSYAEGGVELMKRGMQLDSILREPPRKYALESFTASFKSHPSYRDRLGRLNEHLAMSSINYVSR